MAATTARSPKSARLQGQPPSGPEKSPFQHLAEVAARAQALLNNPKAEKSSFRHKPVHLVPGLDELPRASRLDARPPAASSLPRADLGGRGTGSQPVQDNRSRSDVSFARATGHGTRARRPSTVAQAKNYLRATRSPQFLRSAPDLARHRRKCAICRHPEREMIEEMFIHWHSPQAIARFLGDYDEINWISLYRHAYALGLDLIRRRHLNYIFENILDDAADAIPTFAGIVAAARALSCLTEDGRWVEPEKRITMTTIVRHEDPQALTSTDLVEGNQPAPAGPDYARAEGFLAARQEPKVASLASTLPPARPSPAVAGGGEAAMDAPAPSASPCAALEPQAARLENVRAASHRSAHRERANDGSGASSQPARPRAVARETPRSGTREISLASNSHKTKDNPTSNR